MTHILKGRLPKVLRFATLAVIAGGITTYMAAAAIPDSQGMIHACRLNATGVLRIIDRSANQDCIALTETAMQWASSSSGIAPATYANRVSFNYDAGGTQTIATIPGFGTISAYPCTTGNLDNMNGYWFYTNTSGQTMEYYNPANVALPQILNNGTFLELTGNMVSLAPATGSASKMASLLVHSMSDDQDGKCHYRVMVTATQ